MSTTIGGPTAIVKVKLQLSEISAAAPPPVFNSQGMPQEHNSTSFMIAAQILQVVYGELRRNTSAQDVGVAISVAIAATPTIVREAFELSYATDRLDADDRKLNWKLE